MSDESKRNGFLPLPITTRQFQIGFYVFVILYIAFLLVRGRAFKMDDLLFPLLVGIPTIAIAFVHVVFLTYPSLEERLTPASTDITESMDLDIAGDDQSHTSRTVEEQQRIGLILLGLIIALPIATLYLGFAYVLPPFVLGFIWVFREDPKLALQVTVGFSVAAYVLFILILQMQPWEGELGLPSLLRMLSFG